ncbi:dihydrodipicolinate synthase family protein [Kitasatospora sp. GAS204B]|uniref:dihydrodipicolinate synthase family protein n=1 Tax=unclassified Kitasatospora TaxID=2633591 RepID=UPI00247331D2|nr:dihydrodipicolinate synthase family protein [Kitasatospora sp. GAS204B]MDH6122389.1 4-hydroxy-tetrahydrodipicolinate synthase [Kitasatospora sp. GAS204B]
MFQGVTVALVTPLTSSAQVAEQDVERLVRSVRDHVTALLVTLSTGEGWALTDDQWRTMLATTIQHAAGRLVLAGVQRPTTDQVVERAIEARRLGAAAVVATSPYGPQVSQEEIYQHYAAIAAQSGLAVIVYNESVHSGNATELATLLRICRLPGVAAVKESSGCPQAIKRLIAADPGVPVYQGRERLLLEAGSPDGKAVALANVEPAFCAELFRNPAPARAAELAAYCERYELDREDWYRPLKSELMRRGVLSCDLTVADLAQAGPAAAEGGRAA